MSLPSDLIAGLQDTIQKNLPAAVDSCAKDKKILAEYTEMLSTTAGKYDLALKELQDLRNRLKEIETREKAIELTHKELSIRELKLALKDQEIVFLKEKASVMLEMYKIPFANRTLRETLLVSNNTPKLDQYGNQCGTLYGSENKSSDVTES
jgi:hypothetical protein